MTELVFPSRKNVQRRVRVRTLLCDAGSGRKLQRCGRDRNSVCVIVGGDDPVVEDKTARSTAGRIGRISAVIANLKRQSRCSGYVDRFGEGDGCLNVIVGVVSAGRRGRSELNFRCNSENIVGPAPYLHYLRPIRVGPSGPCPARLAAQTVGNIPPRSTLLVVVVCQPHLEPSHGTPHLEPIEGAVSQKNILILGRCKVISSKYPRCGCALYCCRICKGMKQVAGDVAISMSVDGDHRTGVVRNRVEP